VENESDQMLSLTYTRCFGLAGIFAAIKPFVGLVVSLIRGDEIHLELPHNGVYPYDLQVVVWYVPTYLWNVMASYSAVSDLSKRKCSNFILYLNILNLIFINSFFY